MARETWTVDGYTLTQGTYRDVEYRAGLYGTPEPVGANATVANRTGEVWRPKRHGPGAFTLNLWLGATTTRAGVEAAYDELLRVLTPVHRLCRFTRTLASGEVRRCDGELVAALGPEPIGQRGMRISAEIRVPDGYWEAVTAITATSTVGVGLTRDLALTGFAGATAPMERLTYRITGPGSGPIVSVREADADGTVGDIEAFFYAATLTAGQVLVVNADTWALSGEGGLVPDPGLLSYTGGRYLSVPPARYGAVPTVRLALSSGSGATTSLAVTGRPTFLA